MSKEMLWRKRLLFVSVIFLLWELFYALVASFSYGEHQNYVWVIFLVGSGIIIACYFLWRERISNILYNVGKTLTERNQVVLYVFYFFVAYGLLIKVLALGLHPENFVSDFSALITRIGSILSILILVAFAVIFNRWHASLKDVKKDSI
jgi:hypothetical protein